MWVRVPQPVSREQSHFAIALAFSRVYAYRTCLSSKVRVATFIATRIATRPSMYQGPLSLNKVPNSPYWMVSFIGADGGQKRRSTKVPHQGGLYQGEKLSAAQAKKRAMMVGVSIASAEAEQYTSFDNTSVRELFDLMLAGKLGRVCMATYDNARISYRQFCAWLGARAQAPARLITKADIREWIISRRAEVRCSTVRKDLSAISSAFAWAVDADIMPANPCLGAKVPPDTKDEKVVHEAFSLDEIRLLIQKLPDEWSSAVRCCLGTYGQRLGDILSLRWEQFDWQARVVRITTGKTANTLVQPMRDDFYAWARARYEAALAKGGDAAIWVHPRLHLHSNPSGEFTNLVRCHGIGLVGRDTGGNRRTWHSKTFHSLRASVATMLHAAGVSQVMAMRLVGHESSAIHSVYVRPTTDQLADAAEKLPKL